LQDSDYQDVLLNVILSVNPFTKHSSTKNAIQCYLDHEDFTEATQKFEYFSKMLRIEKELLMTAFLSKHREAFEPDTHSKKKWRERRVENDAFEIKRQEEKIVKQEINRQKADKMLGADVTTKVMDSGDRLKIAAFNQDRAGQLMAILLESKYVRSRTKIGKE
jgi:hypothetical protein